MDSLSYIMDCTWRVLSYNLIISPFSVPIWGFALFPIIFAFICKFVFKRKKL